MKPLDVSVKYKLANGYLLPETAKLVPSIYVGGGVNNISNRWWKNKDRVNTGNYGSFNGGVEFRYNFNQKFNFSYNLGFGYFATDNIDRRIEGTNDMYLQHAFLLGTNF